MGKEYEWYRKGLEDFSRESPKLRDWMERIGIFKEYHEMDYRISYTRRFMAVCFRHTEEVFGGMPNDRRYAVIPDHCCYEFANIAMAHFFHDMMGPALNECLLALGSTRYKNYSHLFLSLCDPFFYFYEREQCLIEAMTMYLCVLEESTVRLGMDPSKPLHEIFGAAARELEDMDLDFFRKTREYLLDPGACLSSEIMDFMAILLRKWMWNEDFMGNIEEIEDPELLELIQGDDGAADYFRFILDDARDYRNHTGWEEYSPWWYTDCVEYRFILTCGFNFDKISFLGDIVKENAAKRSRACPKGNGLESEWIIQWMEELLGKPNTRNLKRILHEIKKLEQATAERCITNTRILFNEYYGFVSSWPGGLKGFSAVSRNIKSLFNLAEELFEPDGWWDRKYLARHAATAALAAADRGYRAFSNLLFIILTGRGREGVINLKRLTILAASMELAAEEMAKETGRDSETELLRLKKRTAEELAALDVERCSLLYRYFIKGHPLSFGSACMIGAMDDISNYKGIRHSEIGIRRKQMAEKIKDGCGFNRKEAEETEEQVIQAFVDDYMEYCKNGGEDSFYPLWMGIHTDGFEVFVKAMEDWHYETVLINKIHEEFEIDYDYFPDMMVWHEVEWKRMDTLVQEYREVGE